MGVNRGSHRVMEKVGFRLVETVFSSSAVAIPGGKLGEVVCEIRRNETQSR